MTRKLHTCVGIIVSRMFLIVSMVPGGEVVLLFSLLPWLVVLYWLWVGCWSDSLPNIMNALPETLDIAVKNVTIPQQQHLGVFIELHSCLIQSWQMPPVLRCKSCIRGSPLDLDSIGEKEKRKAKILSILFKHPNCTCLSTSTSLTLRPFALAK